MEIVRINAHTVDLRLMTIIRWLRGKRNNNICCVGMCCELYLSHKCDDVSSRTPVHLVMANQTPEMLEMLQVRRQRRYVHLASLWCRG